MSTICPDVSRRSITRKSFIVLRAIDGISWSDCAASLKTATQMNDDITERLDKSMDDWFPLTLASDDPVFLKKQEQTIVLSLLEGNEAYSCVRVFTVGQDLFADVANMNRNGGLYQAGIASAPAGSDDDLVLNVSVPTTFTETAPGGEEVVEESLSPLLATHDDYNSVQILSVGFDDFKLAESAVYEE
ncbi:hypothetical protein L202_03969 [Cryptococcus amylolentus CBS 6039]|uniref:Uncharacterized protein n=2 Tax=Cryptococcus amylolentus TaxID=104669 RepID=A0A1E3HQC1_9TREE|nr:hypothetical protein L202_03969 [Cryptococcus amylolentus CBS 6039]ODN78325.1 hypothetical protein L202_03969 [Cryptococcus amylolentus CBS 6039]ODO07078.1 hypothetical protein I350_04446 [Cryptococcus amylolentus CBS 6273]